MEPLMKELRILAINGLMHGNGFPERSLDLGLERDPHVVGIDAGSTDAGPFFLGSGTTMVQRDAAKDVLRTLLTRTAEADVPLLVGSAGTAGSRIHVKWTMDIVREIVEEESLDRRIATIYSDQSSEYLESQFEADRIEPLGRSKPITRSTIKTSDRVVAAMGPEPYVAALERGADVIIAGRSSDVSIFEAVAVRHGFDGGLATHLAKVIECGGQITIPSTGGDCVLGELTKDYFRVSPTNPDKRLDPITVASHMLYESANPYRFVEPRGTLDTTDSEYRSIDEKTVEVRGSRFVPAAKYTVKLEGTRLVGYRALSVMGIRDPVLVEDGATSLLNSARESVTTRAGELGVPRGSFSLTARVYGRDGVMGHNEPTPVTGHELCVLLDVVGPSPEVAKGLVHQASNHLLHGDFPGRKCTAGNVAFPISPQDVSGTAVYEFNIWHRMVVEDPLDPVTIVFERDGGNQ